MSAARSTDRLAIAAREHGLTLRDLSVLCRVSHTLIPVARRGIKRLPYSVALMVEQLTGFAATSENWPLGWSNEAPKDSR